MIFGSRDILSPQCPTEVVRVLISLYCSIFSTQGKISHRFAYKEIIIPNYLPKIELKIRNLNAKV